MSLETIMQFIFVKVQVLQNNNGSFFDAQCITCLLYTSDAADE